MGRIEFINCFPLYLHFEEELARRGAAAEVVAGTPAELNRLLVGGEIDVALPSSIEFARHADVLTLLPRVSISSFGAVDSIQLFGRVPREELRSVALTEKSATSVTLLKVLAREWGSEMTFVPRAPGERLAEVMQHHDGVLLIGDDALHILRAEVYPYHYDLGEEWRRLTGLPMVYAVCAARRDFVAASPAAAAAVEAALVASRDRCAADRRGDRRRRGAPLRLQPGLPRGLLRPPQVRLHRRVPARAGGVLPSVGRDRRARRGARPGVVGRPVA